MNILFKRCPSEGHRALSRLIGRQHSLSDTAIRMLAKANGWTRDFSGAVPSRFRESFVCEGVRANLLAGVTPSEAAPRFAPLPRVPEVIKACPTPRRRSDTVRRCGACGESLCLAAMGACA
jgi:hypothetical protein